MLVLVSYIFIHIYLYIHNFFLLPLDCPKPPNIIAIIGGSVASVAFIGILLLMLIKLFFYMRDLKQWREFEKEKKKSIWAKV